MIKIDCLESFIERSKKIHNNFYTYDKFIYKNTYTKGIITCPTHGDFWQLPKCHLKGKGCIKCAGIYQPTTCEYLEEIKITRKDKGNFYDYSKVNYINNRKEIVIICPKHGEFLQQPKIHKYGCGCPICGGTYISNKEKFVKKSKLIHGNLYNYDKFVYINAHTNGIITCLLHGNFYQTPDNHLRNKRCPKCIHRISKPEMEFLNYIKIIEQNRQKRIGKYNIDGYDVTTNTIYEFLGDFYHGNPEKFSPNDFNRVCHKTFKELYDKTNEKLNILKSFGYNVKYIWENDWNKFKNGVDKTPRIQCW